MKLVNVKVTEFQSVLDSNEFKVGDITCLVGKNEAGKTTILKALYRLNPIISSEGKFSVTDDYPRGEVEDYSDSVERGKREAATVVRAVFALDDGDVEGLVDVFGEEALESREITLIKGYGNALQCYLAVDETKVINYAYSSSEIPAKIKAELAKSASLGKGVISP